MVVGDDESRGVNDKARTQRIDVALNLIVFIAGSAGLAAKTVKEIAERFHLGRIGQILERQACRSRICPIRPRWNLSAISLTFCVVEMLTTAGESFSTRSANPPGRASAAMAGVARTIVPNTSQLIIPRIFFIPNLCPQKNNKILL